MFIYYLVILSYTMETVCIKIEDNLAGKMDQSIKQNGYATKTEFIREAIRKKIDDDQREKLIKEFLKFKGKAKKKTTYEENRRTREKVLLEMAKEKGWEI